MILACDPGITGALASFDEVSMTLLSVMDMPTFIVPRGKNRKIDTQAITDWLLGHRQLGCSRFALEQVQGLPGQGAPSAFTFGYGFGYLLGQARLMGYDVALVRPQEWHSFHFARLASLTENNVKSKSIARATELMPHSAKHWTRKMDHGRAEAALIAWYVAQKDKAL